MLSSYLFFRNTKRQKAENVGLLALFSVLTPRCSLGQRLRARAGLAQDLRPSLGVSRLCDFEEAP